MKSLILYLSLIIFAGLNLTGRSTPNIIYILADDLGYGDVSVYNPDSKIQTPNLDRLASMGMRFTDAHTPSSVCTPTRYGVLTGHYCWRTPLKQGVTWSYGRTFIEEGRETVATLLQEQGYNTAVIGKWHLGLDWALKSGEANTLENAEKRVNEYGVVMNMEVKHIDFTKPVTRGPKEFGFEYSYILPASLDIPPYVYLENHEIVSEPTDYTEGNDLDKGFMDAFWRAGKMSPGFDFYDVMPNFIRRSVDYIANHAQDEKPFFLYIPLPAPHTPWVPTMEHDGSSEAGMYGDFTQQTDAEVGRIMQAVKDAGIERETLIIFTSDNGPYWVPSLTHKYGHQAAAHLRGMKGDIWEGGHRVPYIASWPGKIPMGSISNALTSLTHLISTVADIVGEADPNAHGEDSYSIWEVLHGKSDEVAGQPGIMMHSSRAHFAWREGPWKFIEKRGSGGFSSPVSFDVRMGEATAQLYNLEEDPSETTNLYFKYPEKGEYLSKRLKQSKKGEL